MRRDILVHDVPQDIRTALVAEAKTKNTSLNDLAVSILAEHYGLAWESSDKAFQGGSGNNLTIRGGVKLHKKIDVERARRGGGTLRGVVLEKLALHYNIEPPPIGRRPRVRRKKEIA